LTPVEKADSYGQKVERFLKRIISPRHSAAQKLSRQLQVLKDLHESVVGHVHPGAVNDIGHSDESQRIAIMDRIAAYLGTLPNRLAVECPLGHGDRDAISSITALAETLASMPDDSNLDRLIFGFRWMGKNDISRKFREAVRDASGGRCHPIALPYLVDFGMTEFEDWFKIGLDKGNLRLTDKQLLIKHAFNNQELKRIRLRHLYSAYDQLSSF
jgi:hypothetical protein